LHVKRCYFYSDHEDDIKLTSRRRDLGSRLQETWTQEEPRTVPDRKQRKETSKSKRARRKGGTKSGEEKVRLQIGKGEGRSSQYLNFRLKRPIRVADIWIQVPDQTSSPDSPRRDPYAPGSRKHSRQEGFRGEKKKRERGTNALS